MNKEQKAAVIDEVVTQIQESDAIFAVDYRGISVSQVAELRERLSEADATLRVVKNTLTERAADQAGAETLKDLLQGPTAFTFVRGDAALAAKAIATFRREHEVPAFKGGTMDGVVLSIDEIEAISKLPARDVLNGQLVGIMASPVTGLVRGLNQLIAGLAQQLGQIAEQGLVTGEAPAPEPEPEPEAAPEPEAEAAPAEEEAAPAEEAEAAPAEEEAPAEEPAAEEAPEEQASGDSPAENENDDAPSEGDEKEG
jgi:large subunit ribosomal protein L10